MSPSDRPKRPSARPAAKPSGATGEGREAPAPAPQARKSEAKSHKVKSKPKPRVSARRPSLPPEPVTQATSEAAEPARTPRAHPSKPGPGSQRASSPASPAANGVEAPSADDDDIWSEGSLGGEALLDAPAQVESVLRAPALSRLSRGSSEAGPRDDAARLGSAQALLSTDYYFRQYGPHGMRSLSAEVDDFGLDPHVEESARPLLEALCKRYFRVDVSGAEHLPERGRALIVANRSGVVPWDGLVLRTALRMSRPELQPVRWLSEDSVIHYPFLGVFMNRLGAVRACPENAERLLARDRLVAVFPEGAQGSGKLFKERYQLQRFARGGYIKLALKLGAPIIPTAIIGGEETNPMLARSRLLGRALGSQFMPITPTFPWLGPAGLLPAPVKWRILVGEPIDLASYGPKSADDALVVHRLNEQVRGILQALVSQGRASRRSLLFG